MSHQALEEAAHVFPLWLPHNASSGAAGYESVHHVAGGPCRLFGFYAYSSRATAQFILLFDSVEVPASGATGIPFPVAATNFVSGYYGWPGRWFNRGIWLANSTTSPTLTAGAADTFFDAQWV